MSASATAAFDEVGFLCGENAQARSVYGQVLARQQRSATIHARAQASASGLPSMLPYMAPLLPICVAHAAGARLSDADGNEYIDCHMSYSASILGHSPEMVTTAVRAALDRGPTGGYFVEPQVELAELVREMVPGVERVCFYQTGGEAVATAVRIARAATQRQLVAKFEGCYHGANEIGLHNTMMALSGRPPARDPADIAPSAATGGMRTAAADFLILPFNDSRALDRLQARHKELACIVIDPVPPFMANWPDVCRAFVRSVCACAHDLGITIVFDEVVCGFRVARGGAREWIGAQPDLSCFGKITSGLGLPLSIVAGAGALLDQTRSAGGFLDYRTQKVWATHTLACGFLPVVAALAQLRYLHSQYDQLMARLDRNYSYLTQRVAECASATGVPVRLEGHPRLQMCLSVGASIPSEKTFRGVMLGASIEQYRLLRLLTLYLRVEGIYTKALPTMNLSAAHTEADVERVADGIARAIHRMVGDGVLSA